MLLGCSLWNYSGITRRESQALACTNFAECFILCSVPPSLGRLPDFSWKNRFCLFYESRTLYRYLYYAAQHMVFSLLFHVFVSPSKLGARQRHDYVSFLLIPTQSLAPVGAWCRLMECAAKSPLVQPKAMAWENGSEMKVLIFFLLSGASETTHCL